MSLRLPRGWITTWWWTRTSIRQQANENSWWRTRLRMTSSRSKTKAFPPKWASIREALLLCLKGATPQEKRTLAREMSESRRKSTREELIHEEVAAWVAMVKPSRILKKSTRIRSSWSTIKLLEWRLPKLLGIRVRLIRLRSCRFFLMTPVSCKNKGWPPTHSSRASRTASRRKMATRSSPGIICIWARRFVAGRIRVQILAHFPQSTGPKT